MMSMTLMSVALLTPRAACAADGPSAEDHDRARVALSVGRQKRAEGDHAGALEAFKRAHEIENLSTTGLEVGRTLIDLGRLMEAREHLLQIARAPATPGEPPPIAAARTDARQLIDRLEGIIPTLAIKLEGRLSPNVSVTVDGVVVAMETLSEKRRLDPGVHVIRVHRGRAKPTELEVEAKNEHREVTLRIPEDPDAAAAAGAGAAGATFERFPPTPVKPTKEERSYTIAWIAGAAAVVGVAVGTTTGVIAANKKDDLQCPGEVCPPSEHESLREAKSIALVSTIAFLVSGVAAGVAAWDIFLRAPEPTPPNKTARARSWWVDPRGGGVLVKF